MLDTLNPKEIALATWSGIARPGETQARMLVDYLGPVAALEWAQSPHMALDPKFDLDLTHPKFLATTMPWDELRKDLQKSLATFNLEYELEELAKLGGRIVTEASPDWPTGFKDLKDARPYALWVIGNLPTDESKIVSLVGSRASTSYGNTIAHDFGFDLSDSGYTIASGGAYGIETAALQGVLENVSEDNHQGPTVPAVVIFSAGLKTVYPTSNTKLFDAVVENGGGLVSEFPPSFIPAKFRFLARLRLIAAISTATIAIEGSSRSGAIRTIELAQELQKKVGTVPGMIHIPSYFGTNQLLRQSVTAITSFKDMLELVNESQ